MPRQRILHRRETYAIPVDFPERLKRFQAESGLSWAEIARRLGAHPFAVRRWVLGRARPSMAYMMALLDLAGEQGHRHIFMD